MEHRLQTSPRLMEEPGSGSDQEPLSIYCQPCSQLSAWLPNLPRDGSRPHASRAEGLSPHLQAGLSASRPGVPQKESHGLQGQTIALLPRTGHLQENLKEAAAWYKHQMWQICSHRRAEVTLPVLSEVPPRHSD